MLVIFSTSAPSFIQAISFSSSLPPLCCLVPPSASSPLVASFLLHFDKFFSSSHFVLCSSLFTSVFTEHFSRLLLPRPSTCFFTISSPQATSFSGSPSLSKVFIHPFYLSYCSLFYQPASLHSSLLLILLFTLLLSLLLLLYSRSSLIPSTRLIAASSLNLLLYLPPFY